MSFCFILSQRDVNICKPLRDKFLNLKLSLINIYSFLRILFFKTDRLLSIYIFILIKGRAFSMDD